MTSEVTTTITADVCVAGGGPAGLMTALLLTRQGIRVVLLEKHADFLRDFRGDTVHPSTLDLLDELGLGQELAELPHRDVERLTVTFAGGTFTLADFSRLRVAHPYIRFMPQWHLLNLLAEAAEQGPTFTLLRSHEVTDIVRDRGIVTGVRAVGPGGEVQVRAYLTIAADGRASVIRERLALPSVTVAGSAGQPEPQYVHRRRWYAPGVLLIGDAAHAMSPIGGVGINLAVQDAVATTRMLAPGIISRRLSTRTLAKVQRRRAFPTMGTQAVQLAVQRFFLERVLAADASLRAPRPLRWMPAALQKLPAGLIGVGLRPEHLDR